MSSLTRVVRGGFGAVIQYKCPKNDECFAIKVISTADLSMLHIEDKNDFENMIIEQILPDIISGQITLPEQGSKKIYEKELDMLKTIGFSNVREVHTEGNPNLCCCGTIALHGYWESTETNEKHNVSRMRHTELISRRCGRFIRIYRQNKPMVGCDYKQKIFSYRLRFVQPDRSACYVYFTERNIML